MSEFIVILCIAVFASATHAASIEKPQTLEEIKDECADLITKRFDGIKDVLSDMSEKSETKVGRAIYDNAVIFVKKLIKKLRTAKSIDRTKEPHNIFFYFPAKCGSEIADAMDNLIWSALINSGTVVIKK